MDDFSKTKTAFAAGFLALLLAAQSAFSSYLGEGLDVFGLEITLGQVFWATTGFLALSVYATGLRLLTDKAWPRTELIANVCYALAITVPPATAAVVALSAIARWLLKAPAAASAATSLLSALAGMAAVIVTSRLNKRLRARTDESVVRKLQREEAAQFSRAEDLFRQGHYDLAVIDAFRSLETAVRKRLTAIGKLVYGPRVQSPLTDAVKHGVVPLEMRRELEFVRNRRNWASHSIEPTSREDAERVLATTARLLARVTPDDDPVSNREDR